jgi:hypothetical protein
MLIFSPTEIYVAVKLDRVYNFNISCKKQASWLLEKKNPVNNFR